MSRRKLSLNLPREGTIKPNGPSDPLPYYYKPLIGRLYIARINTVLGLLPPRKFERVLEIGYGSGILVPTIAPYVEEYVGIDLAPTEPSLISRLHETGVDCEKIKFVQGDISALGTDLYEVIIAISVFEHIENLDGLLSDLRKKLKPDGLLLVGMPRVDRIMTWIFEHGIRFKGIDDHHVSSFRVFMESAAESFEVVETAHMPAHLPRFSGLYYAALLRAR
jgi:cyclopropane fatty-acyl-phospholipid synthase-like methyltransferase